MAWRLTNRALLFGLAIIMLFYSPMGATGVGNNLVIDGGFERSGADAGRAAWILKAGAFIQDKLGQADVEGIPGYAGISNSSEDYKSEIVQPLLPLVPDRQYVLIVNVRAEKGKGEAVIGVRQQHVFPRLYRTLSPSPQWQRMEFVFTPEKGWAQVVLSGAAGIQLVWDNIELRESSSISQELAQEWERRLENGEKIYTGLVVNALGTGLERGMSPKILDKNNNVIFKGTGASEEQLITYGLVAYVHTLEEAVKHPRLKVSDEYPLQLPLIVDAQKAVGYPQPNFPPISVVVGDEDAKRIREALEQNDFLDHFALVFVVD